MRFNKLLILCGCVAGIAAAPVAYAQQPAPADTPMGFRTMCVRSCDGYYFPISTTTTEDRFDYDAGRCEAQCSGAKLYHLPSGTNDIAGMTDTDGNRYDALPMSFAYRKALINGCTCRPMPWTAAEASRHASYQEKVPEVAKPSRGAVLAAAPPPEAPQAEPAETGAETPEAVSPSVEQRQAAASPIRVRRRLQLSRMQTSGPLRTPMSLSFRDIRPRSVAKTDLRLKGY